MKMVVAWWDLSESAQTIDSLQTYLNNGETSPWGEIPGLKLKMWISDSANNLWGALMLWESKFFMSQNLPPNKATELIGYPPSVRFSFDIEAIVGKDSSLLQNIINSSDR